MSQFFVERTVPLMLGVSCTEQNGYDEFGGSSYAGDEFGPVSSYSQEAVADCTGEVNYIMKGFPFSFSECTERDTGSDGKCALSTDAALIILWNIAVLTVPGLILGSIYEGVRQHRKNHRRQSTG